MTIDKENGYVIVRFPWKADEKEFNPKRLSQSLRDCSADLLTDGSTICRKPGKESVSGQNPSTEDLLCLEFNEEGSKLFSDATKKLIDKT